MYMTPAKAEALYSAELAAHTDECAKEVAAEGRINHLVCDDILDQMPREAIYEIIQRVLMGAPAEDVFIAEKFILAVKHGVREVAELRAIDRVWL